MSPANVAAIARPMAANTAGCVASTNLPVMLSPVGSNAAREQWQPAVGAAANLSGRSAPGGLNDAGNTRNTADGDVAMALW
jgi:hypothetical protein